MCICITVYYKRVLLFEELSLVSTCGPAQSFQKTWLGIGGSKRTCSRAGSTCTHTFTRNTHRTVRAAMRSIKLLSLPEYRRLQLANVIVLAEYASWFNTDWQAAVDIRQHEAHLFEDLRYHSKQTNKKEKFEQVTMMMMKKK